MADSVTVADLNLKIRSEGEKAAEGIAVLTTAFTGLSQVGLGTIQTQLKAIAASFATITGAAAKAANVKVKVPAVATTTTGAASFTKPNVMTGVAGTYSERQTKATEAAKLRLEAATIRLTLAEENLRQIEASGKATEEGLAAAYAKVASASASVISAQESVRKNLDNVAGSSKSLKSAFEQQTPAAQNAAKTARIVAASLKGMSNEERQAIIQKEKLSVATQRLAAALHSGNPAQISAARRNLATVTQQLAKVEQQQAAAAQNAAKTARATAASMRGMSTEERQAIIEEEKLTSATQRLAAALRSGNPAQVSSARRNLASVTQQAAKAERQQAAAAQNSAQSTNTLASSSQRLGSAWQSLSRVGRGVTNILRGMATAIITATRHLVTMMKAGEKDTSLLRTLQRIRVNLYNIWYLAQVAKSAFNAIFNKASESYEILHLFKGAFSDNTEAGDAAAESMYNVYKSMGALAGLDVAPMLRTASVFREMANAMGMASDASDIISQGLTQLTYDYASYFDIDFATVAGKFQSALSGQTRAIRTFGLDITQAALQQELYNEGINASITDLTRAEKTILIYNAIMRHSTNAQQDFAASVRQPANMLRVLQEQASLAARSFGALFIPAINAVLPYLIAFANALQAIFGRIIAFFGIKMPDLGSVAAGGLDSVDGLTDSLEDTESAADGAANSIKKLKDYTTGLDELNILRPDDGTSGGGGGGTSGAGGVGGITPVDPYDFLGGRNPMADILSDIKDGLDKINAGWMKIENGAVDAFTSIRQSYRTIVAEGVVRNFNNTFIRAIVSSETMLANFFHGFATAWRSAGTAVMRNMYNAMSGILDVAIYVQDTIGAWFRNETGQSWLRAILNGFALMQLAIVKVTDKFKAMWSTGGADVINDSVLPALASIVTTFEKIYENTMLAVGAFVEWGFKSGFLTTITKTLRNITALLTDASNQVTDWLLGTDGEPFRQSLQGIADAAFRFTDAVREWWNNGGGRLAEMLVTDISAFVGSIGAFAASLVEIGALTVIVEIADAVVNMVSFLAENADILAVVAGIVAALVIGIKGLKFAATIAPLFAGLGAAAVPAAAGISSLGAATTASAPGLLSLAAVIGAIALAIGALLFGVAAIVTAVADLIGAFSNFTSVLVDKVMPNWDKFKTMIEEGVGLLGNSLLGLAGPLLLFLVDLGLGLGAVALGVAAVGLAATLNAIGLAVLAGLFTSIVILSQSVGTNLISLEPIVDTLCEQFGKFTDVLDGLHDSLENVGDVVADIFKGVGNIVRDGINEIIRGINNFISSVNRLKVPDWVPDVGGKSFSMEELPYLARGGIAGAGQLFVAGEAGPELVGRFNGNRNTVMPLENSGFVEAMSGAVYAAVIAAMSERTSGSNGDVYLDAAKVGKVLDRNDRVSGSNGRLVPVGA